MEKYENLGMVGEGSYGMVMKCRHKESGRIVAIKKFLESEDDKMVKKIAMREIKLLKASKRPVKNERSDLIGCYGQLHHSSSTQVLKGNGDGIYQLLKGHVHCVSAIRKQQLRHENLVNLLEVCKKKKRLYLVFEFVDRTVLDDLEQFPNGLDFSRVRKYLFQIIRGIGFCHNHNIIHRDIKPENILVSHTGVVKLCDFGFARTLAAPGEVYTDYVATRWYRAPELLVGDIKYGKAVDVWAIGCLVTEMLTGEPLFPGDSDIDQLYHIVKCQGNLTPRLQELFYNNPLFAGVTLPEIKEVESLEKRYPKLSPVIVDLAKNCLQIDPDRRPSCMMLLQHDLFKKDGFSERFSQEISAKVQKLSKDNPSPPRKMKNSKKDDYPGEKKALAIQDFNIESKGKDVKPLKVKIIKMDTDRSEKSDVASNASTLFNGPNQNRTTPYFTLKESSTGLDQQKIQCSIIPPISYNPPAISPHLTSSTNASSVSTHVSFRGEDRGKMFVNSLKKSGGKPSPGYNQNVTTLIGNGPLQLNKKKWEFSRADMRLPELSYGHLPELKSTDVGSLYSVRSSRLVKKENKTLPESRIPSLAMIDPHNTSTALPQFAGNSPQDHPDVSEGNFPPVEH